MEKKLLDKLEKRKTEGTIRSLSLLNDFVDFYSNDYLGFAKVKTSNKLFRNFASTGSRLISGTSEEAIYAENFLANFYHSESALIYNSGYDANLGFFSAIPQRGDTVFFDEFIHASIRDGIRLSFANSLAFKHNDLNSLESKMSKVKGVKYVVVESLYSMDGDIAPLIELSSLCTKWGAYLIVDEAHASGVFGNFGKGMVSELSLENDVFARIVTFGKAYGAHGACILGSNDLKDFLINFSRSFIYTTALPPEAYLRIVQILEDDSISERNENLKKNIQYFRSNLNLENCFSDPNSPIQLVKISDIELTKRIAEKLQFVRLAVKPIFSPTVPIGNEGLRICIHSFNSFEEIDNLIKNLHS